MNKTHFIRFWFCFNIAIRILCITYEVTCFGNNGIFVPQQICLRNYTFSEITSFYGYWKTCRDTHLQKENKKERSNKNKNYILPSSLLAFVIQKQGYFNTQNKPKAKMIIVTAFAYENKIATCTKNTYLCI